MHPVIGFTALLCIAVGAGAAGALNMWFDADIDAMMTRTRAASGADGPRAAGRGAGVRTDACGLCRGGARPAGERAGRRAARLHHLLLRRHLHDVAQALDAAEHRDRRRRRRLPADDRLGGGDRLAVGSSRCCCSCIIFFWTPPHFWALALNRTEDYARAGIPMLPVVAGEASTRRQILLYTLILVPLGIAPWALGYAGMLYGLTAVVTGAIMLALAWQVFSERRPAERASQASFRLLDPVSVLAVCRAAGRARMGRADRPVGGVTSGIAMNTAAERRGRRPHRGAEARAALALDRHRAVARRAGDPVLRGDLGEGSDRAGAPAMTNDAPQRQRKPLRRDMLIAAALRRVGRRAWWAPPLPRCRSTTWFCRATGFAGTTQVSPYRAQARARPQLTVRFDSNVAPGLPWKFEPEQNEIKLHIGEVATVHYKVINEAARTITAQASYNVSPPTVGAYFDKINCFCFTEQTMKPGETREMTVVFYVDPAIVKDHDQDALNTHHAVLYVLSAARRRSSRWRTATQTKHELGQSSKRRRRWPTAHAKHHDYHLVDPSPWPAVGATSAFLMAFGGITWMHHMFAAAPLVFGVGVDRHPLYLHRLVARRDPRGAVRGLPHPRGADLAPLRHDPVHRLRGDVLRRLVLGLFQHRVVPRRRERCRPPGLHARRLAAAGHRDLRSLASAAAQHADPAHLGHHGDLGASRAAWRTTGRA